jgi:2-polyprenyl-3-methyl-5-hydroxy-6-metoxy-1,4-benzoquinol methylase
MTSTRAPADRLQADTRHRALRSGGASSHFIYSRVAELLAGRGIEGGTLLDLGCGRGDLLRFLGGRFQRYIGVDVVRYEGLPPDAEFVSADLSAGLVPLPDGCADVVASIETIEHLENPRHLAREMTRLARPSGLIVLTTPNQLSLLSMLTLIVRKRFSAFQDVNYPAHITALLESDLRRIASECSLEDVAVEYTLQGRIVGTPWNYPRPLSTLAPRLLSDNAILMARKPLSSGDK